MCKHFKETDKSHIFLIQRRHSKWVPRIQVKKDLIRIVGKCWQNLEKKFENFIIKFDFFLNFRGTTVIIFREFQH